VIGPSDKGDQKFDVAQPYHVLRVPGYEWGYGRFLSLLLTTPWAVLRYKVRKAFAMNIAYGGVLCWALSLFTPLEYLIFAYGYEFEKVGKNPWAKKLYLSIYRRAKKIITCSRLVKDRLIQFGAPPEKIEVLYPAVDLERFYPCHVPAEFLTKKGLSGRRILLTVGRLVERKGHDQVLKALSLIVRQFPDLLYCIVGIGPHREALEKQIRAAGLEKHVCFLGKVPAEELAFLYNACEIFIMPSREISDGGHIEGFGIVYLEANACGKPVIGGRSGGVPEAIQDGETGFLVDPENPKEIANRISELLLDPGRAKAMGGQGLRWVRGNFNWDEYAKQAYRWLCE
jgi:phosphatidylinositol alpha-1,6-mannosyltransferase